MDIVYQQNIDTPVFLAEVQNLAVLEMVDQIVHEFFCRDIQNFEAAVLVQNAVSDRIHQVSFS